MKCRNLFSGKNKKNTINLLSVDFAQRAVGQEMKQELLKKISANFIPVGHFDYMPWPPGYHTNNGKMKYFQ